MHEYFSRFVCEKLRDNKENKSLIQSFESTNHNSSLGKYLQEDAWKRDEYGATKVYLIKDKAGNIVFYFSLRCGLLYESSESVLKEEDKDYVSMVLDAIKKGDKGILCEYKESGLVSYDSMKRIKQYSCDLEKKTEGALPVKTCLPAVELCHFCKNDNYAQVDDVGIPIGVGLFWEIVFPKGTVK